MFLLRRPSLRDIARFTAASRELPLSCGPVGLAKGVPAGFTVDDAVVCVGYGQVALDRAQSALAAWKHFDIDWVQVFPVNASTEPGTVVTVLVHRFGFWSLNGCRVVYKSDSTAAAGLRIAH